MKVAGKINSIQPESISEVSDAVRSVSHLVVGQFGGFSLPVPARQVVAFEAVQRLNRKIPTDPQVPIDPDALFRYREFEGPVSYLRLDKLKGITQLSANDLTVSLLSGSLLHDIQETLAPLGLCIPVPFQIQSDTPTNHSAEANALDREERQNWFCSPDPFSTLADSISLNLPHGLESQNGTWKDWILSATVVLADGTVAKAGSKVVKNVAGFDLQKLIVGSRHTLAVPVEVTLRVAPKESATQHNVQFRDNDLSGTIGLSLWIQRVRNSDFPTALRGLGILAIAWDQSTGTIWAEVPPEREGQRFPDDWVIRSNCGAKNISITDPTQIALMKKAKAIFDPTNKLNPGEFGFL